ncbi:PilZ domain-containing protein [Desulfogranum japonicum]|uniref:PilZ domain-containing protein n=1 Tax=Desulfogranum japonicum TaxID=231447 RepID=UPI00040CB3C8|nr:PilZ domain-containing protein [Desulfogranum japonicum]
MANIKEIIEKLESGSAATITLQEQNGDLARLTCAFRSGESPSFDLLFPPNSLKIPNLIMGINCQLVVKHRGNDVNIIAELDKVVNERCLRLIGREPIRPEALREYFRVGINTSIEIGYTPEAREVRTNAWQMLGTTIDLSASGVLALFAEKPPSKKRLYIRITDPESNKIIHSHGHVVRSYRMRKNRYQVAIHFEKVAQKTRDALIALCFQEQRKQLRENIQTADNWL